ncbi:hypothetical protein [Streptomyces kanasensis]|uniref:hypothetical protein n=1 Tax=Streptomyces kanasensis TaxID=936756 RepID=UPI00380C6E97
MTTRGTSTTTVTANPYSLGGGWDSFNGLTGPGDGQADLLGAGGTLYPYRGDGRGHRVADRTGLGTG